MPGIKKINTYTTINVVDPSYDIYTYYDDNISEIFSTFINENLLVINNQSINQGHGVIIYNEKKVPKDVNFQLDADGHLIFFGKNAHKYSIDNNGHLIYTE